MASARISVFCTLQELSDWVKLLCHEKDLGCIRYCGEDFGIVTAPTELQLDNRTYTCFLYPISSPPRPRLAMNDVNPRPWGWVDVSRNVSPRCAEGALLPMSEIYGDDTDLVPASKYVRWLKGRLKRTGQIRAGVRGWVDLAQGVRVYNDVNYTEGARRLFEAGVPWKQFFDGKMFFGPAAGGESQRGG